MKNVPASDGFAPLSIITMKNSTYSILLTQVKIDVKEVGLNFIHRYFNYSLYYFDLKL